MLLGLSLRWMLGKESTEIEIFRNDVTYDNIKHQGPFLSLEDKFLEKP